MRLELRHLRSFLAVAEELHFGRAAQKLHLAQPSLSVQIMQLEEALGVRLLLRARRKVALTPAGEMMQQVARRLLTELSSGVEAVRSAGEVAAQMLNVGTVDLAYTRLDSVISLFSTPGPIAPGPMLSIPPLRWSMADAASLLSAVRAGALDAALVHAPVDDEQLAALPVLHERYVVALPCAHPLANGPDLPLSALADQSWLLPPRTAAPDKHDEILSFCRRAGFEPRVVAWPPTLTAALGAVAQRLGVCLVPAGAALVQPGVAFRNLRSPAVVVSLVLVWHRERPTHGARHLLSWLAQSELSATPPLPTG